MGEGTWGFKLIKNFNKSSLFSPHLSWLFELLVASHSWGKVLRWNQPFPERSSWEPHVPALLGLPRPWPLLRLFSSFQNTGSCFLLNLPLRFLCLCRFMPSFFFLHCHCSTVSEGDGNKQVCLYNRSSFITYLTWKTQELNLLSLCIILLGNAVFCQMQTVMWNNEIGFLMWLIIHLQRQF